MSVIDFPVHSKLIITLDL